MDAKIHYRIDREQLLRIVMPDTRVICEGLVGPGLYDAVAFSRRPVRLGNVVRTTRKLKGSTPQSTVVTGPGFTREAADWLEAHGYILVTRDRHFWSEKSDEHIHTSIATNKKRP